MIIELIHPQIPIGYKKATIIEIVVIPKYLLIRYTRSGSANNVSAANLPKLCDAKGLSPVKSFLSL